MCGGLLTMYIFWLFSIEKMTLIQNDYINLASFVQMMRKYCEYRYKANMTYSTLNDALNFIKVCWPTNQQRNSKINQEFYPALKSSVDQMIYIKMRIMYHDAKKKMEPICYRKLLKQQSKHELYHLEWSSTVAAAFPSAHLVI